MKRPILLVILSGLGIAADHNFVTDQTNAQLAGMNVEQLARIPTRMQDFVDAGKTAGIVTLIARHGYVAALSAVGYQDLERKTPMKTDSIFRVMSVTKPVTCAGIMVLIDEGRLSLIDPVERFIPEFKGLKVNPCGTRVGQIG
jgi:CubicO group peptidase (beta-lactamase class C family)